MEHSKTNFGWVGSQQKGLKMSWLHWLMKFPQCVLMGEALREQLKLLTYLKCICLKELCGFPSSATTARVANPSILTPRPPPVKLFGAELLIKGLERIHMICCAAFILPRFLTLQVSSIHMFMICSLPFLLPTSKVNGEADGKLEAVIT